MGRAAGEVHPPTADFDEEQYVQPLEPDRIDGKEIDSNEASRLRLKELTPRGTRPSTRWTQQCPAHYVPDGGRRYGNAQSFQFTHDAQIAPPRILARDPQNQLSNLAAHRPAAWSSPIRPTPSDQPPMPIKQRGRLDEECVPYRARQQPTRGR